MHTQVFILGTLLALSSALTAYIELNRRRMIENLDRAERARESFSQIAVKERAAVVQLRVQLAGCGAAALGAISPEHVAKKGQYGWSPAYQDVLDLRREVEALRNACDHAIELLEAWDAQPGDAVNVLRASKEAAVLLRADRST
jgi:hypothetical protein